MVARLAESGAVKGVRKSRAQRIFDAGCKNGDAPSCAATKGRATPVALAAIGPEENRLSANAPPLSRRYARGCDTGDQLACAILGQFYASSHGVARDAAHAVVLLRPACADGSMPACVEIVGLPRNAATFMAGQMICEHGDVSACVATARGLENDDRERARRLYAEMCEPSRVEGCIAAIDFAKRVRDGDAAHAPDRDTAEGLFSLVCFLAAPVGCAGVVATANLIQADGAPAQRVALSYQLACSRAQAGCAELSKLIDGVNPVLGRF
jgi:TPR repeat protein